MFGILDHLSKSHLLFFLEDCVHQRRCNKPTTSDGVQSKPPVGHEIGLLAAEHKAANGQQV